MKCAFCSRWLYLILFSMRNRDLYKKEQKEIIDKPIWALHFNDGPVKIDKK